MEYLGMPVDQIKVDEMGNYSINLKLANEVTYNLHLHNGVLNTLKDYSDPSSDLAVSVSKADFIKYLYVQVNLDELTSTEKIKIEVNIDILTTLRSVIDLTIKNNMNLVLPLQEVNKIN